MQTFLLATKLSPESTRDPAIIKENGRRWLEAVKVNCPEVKWLNHYALSIYQAPDLETAAKVSVISMSLGALKAESWPAIPYHDFVEMLGTIR